MPSENTKYCNVAEQSAWGTPQNGTKSFEIRGDTFAQVFKPVEAGETTYYQQQGKLPHNWQQTLEKVTGEMDMVVYRAGQGLVWKNLLGAASTPAAVTSTTNGRYSRTYTTTADGSGTLLTAHIGRVRRTANNEAYESEQFTYDSLMCSGFELGVSADNPWTLKPGFVGRAETTGGAAVAQTYPTLTDAGFFSWQTTALSVGGSAFDVFNGCNIQANYNLNDAIKTLQNSSNILKPLRKGLPAITGTLSGGLYSTDVANDLYSKARSGEAVEIELECKIRPAGYVASPAVDHSLDILRVTLPTCRLLGNTPSGPPGSTTMIEMPFEVQWSGTGAMMSVYLQNGEQTDA